MASRNKLAFYYFAGAIVLFAIGYGLAWFSEQPLFSKEVFPQNIHEEPKQEPSRTPLPDEGQQGEATASVKPGRQYEVQPGDTISSVAEANDLSFEELAQYNDIPYPYNLAVGQVIVIPE
ncbi:MAG TPA: LysM domain-containing protein [Patescibacteria group bacterium]